MKTLDLANLWVALNTRSESSHNIPQSCTEWQLHTFCWHSAEPVAKKLQEGHAWFLLWALQVNS